MSAALIWLLLRPLIGAEVSRAGALLRTVILALVMTGWWVALNQLARNGPRLLAPLIAFLVAVGAAGSSQQWA